MTLVSGKLQNHDSLLTPYPMTHTRATVSSWPTCYTAQDKTQLKSNVRGFY